MPLKNLPCLHPVVLLLPLMVYKSGHSATGDECCRFIWKPSLSLIMEHWDLSSLDLRWEPVLIHSLPFFLWTLLMTYWSLPVPVVVTYSDSPLKLSVLESFLLVLYSWQGAWLISSLQQERWESLAYMLLSFFMPIREGTLQHRDTIHTRGSKTGNLDSNTLAANKQTARLILKALQKYDRWAGTWCVQWLTALLK